MSKKTIAIDIDDVLSANAAGFIAYSNLQWGTNLKEEDYDEHWAKLWGTDHAETQRRAVNFHLSGVVGQYEHDPTALPILEELAKEYRLVITTSRRKELVLETTQWLNKYFNGIFEEIHYAGMWDEFNESSHTATKAELCREIGADYLIDDQPKHCIGAAEADIPALLFGEYTWNKDVQLPDNVTRVKDWQAVKEYFDERS